MADNIQNNTEELSTEQLSEQMQIRRDKLSAMRSEGFDPFTKTKYDFDTYSSSIKADFDSFDQKVVSLAGRLMSKRIMGKASFANLRDGKGDIQIYVRRDDVGEDDYAAFKKYDIGDVIGVKGFVFKTATGEISVHLQHIELLSKSLIPLPEKFHGLKDQDMRYRQRYVDLIVNPEVKDTFLKRSQILKELRAYLDNKGFLEVDTPILVPIEIGASARPFKTHHNTLDMDMYLRIETELYLKRLIVGGMDRVYEVGRIFRNEGMDPKHNPEFTSIELYQAYTDFHGMMDLVEDMYKTVTKAVCGSLVINYQGIEIDMGKWERLTMIEAVKKYSGVDYYDWKSDEDARVSAKANNVEVPENATKGTVLAEFFDAFVEDKLIQPTFIYDYPVENSPLAKRKPDDPMFTERFEYFINCTEYGNAFSELNDPIDQKERFEKQVKAKRLAEENCTAEVDYDYVTALEYGMPPTGGLGFGIDRLVMLLTDSASIRDVLLFPTMKPEKAPAKDSAPEKKGEAKKSALTRDQAFNLLKKYNSDPFHIRHGLTVEGVMKWFANDLGYGDEEDFWAQVGLLHDIDFEQYPEEHCIKAPELLSAAGVKEDMIHAICSHAFGLCCDVEPTLKMEKVLFAADELTGLIWSYALMRPEKSCEGMELKSLKKKFKDKKFAAGCSRDVIEKGSEMLGWELDELLEKTIKAMQSCEQSVNEACK